MRYGFRDLSFDVDARWTDETVVALVDEGALTLTVVREKKSMPLKAIVDDALRQLGTSLSGFRMLQREERAVGERAAVLVVGSTLDPEMGALVQHQAYVDVGDDVVVFTATAPEAAGAPAKAALETALASLRVGA